MEGGCAWNDDRCTPCHPSKFDGEVASDSTSNVFRIALALLQDNTMLYAEILDLVATICSRGSARLDFSLRALD